MQCTWNELRKRRLRSQRNNNEKAKRKESKGGKKAERAREDACREENSWREKKKLEWSSEEGSQWYWCCQWTVELPSCKHKRLWLHVFYWSSCAFYTISCSTPDLSWSAQYRLLYRLRHEQQTEKPFFDLPGAAEKKAKGPKIVSVRNIFTPSPPPFTPLPPCPPPPPPKPLRKKVLLEYRLSYRLRHKQQTKVRKALLLRGPSLSPPNPGSATSNLSGLMAAWNSLLFAGYV